MDVFFFNDTATTEIYTLSLHDALPISIKKWLLIGLLCLPTVFALVQILRAVFFGVIAYGRRLDKEMRSKSTRLNSSHANISYAVFCLKKKTRRRSSDTVISRHGGSLRS